MIVILDLGCFDFKSSILILNYYLDYILLYLVLCFVLWFVGLSVCI